jgi:heme-degrading monooxygenase HmoA|tara:strand:- start:367 stop:654 length:288 start_codon:yes stop_codon:yes gene_type:complete
MMIGILTHHWAKPNLMEEARKLLDLNGSAQKLAKGFVARQTLLSLTDQTKITSIVTWKSEETYDMWKSSRERAQIMTGSERYWNKPPESERFSVV